MASIDNGQNPCCNGYDKLNYRFCRVCGSEISRTRAILEMPENNPEEGFCGNCGKPNHDGSARSATVTRNTDGTQNVMSNDLPMKGNEAQDDWDSL